MRAVLSILGVAVALAGCADAPLKRTTRWDAYYASAAAPRPAIRVTPPEGTTVPMAKLIAEYVTDYLKKEDIAASVGDGGTGAGKHYLLNGRAALLAPDETGRRKRVMTWMLSDAQGRVISSHTLAVDGTEAQWDYGDAQVLTSIGLNTAAPVARLVRAEVGTKVPVDPTSRGLLLDPITGLDAAAAGPVADALAEALRGTDLLVTGDLRQATYRLA
ncbi:MAG: hypothetical protein HQL36_04120, partial [Alphaproteobacteria bacterium]|nr:hypothetical protein [Alphaproteobacteria bacterium]